MYKYYEIVKTVFLEEITYKHADSSDRFKIEVYKNPDGSYGSRVLRADLYDLEIREHGKIVKTTEDFDVYFPFFPDLTDKKFSSIDECLNFTIVQIEKETKGYATEHAN